MLLNFVDTELYERQGKAISNFCAVLPAPQSDLAQELTKDPYNFNFLTLDEKYDEKDLKDALVNNVAKLLRRTFTFSTNNLQINVHCHMPSLLARPQFTFGCAGGVERTNFA